jgi:hypothetical protein
VPGDVAERHGASIVVRSWVVDWQIKRLDEFASSSSGWQLLLCPDHDGVLDSVAVCTCDAETKPPYLASLATLKTQASFLIPCPSHGFVLPPYGTARTTRRVYLAPHPLVQLGQQESPSLAVAFTERVRWNRSLTREALHCTQIEFQKVCCFVRGDVVFGLNSDILDLPPFLNSQSRQFP